MSSDDCKAAIVEYYEEFVGVSTKESQWKRTAKIKSPVGVNGYLRIFECKALSLTALVWEQDNGADPDVFEGGPLLYARINPNGDDPCFMFCPQTMWAREKTVPDQEWGHVLELAYVIPAWILEDEACENTFMVPPERMDEAEAALQVRGIVRGPKAMEGK